MAYSCSRSACARLVLPLCALAGCSDSASRQEPEAEPVYVKIDDMEGGDGAIAWTPTAPEVESEPGRWRSYVDAQCEGVEPPPRSIAGAAAWPYAALVAPYPTVSGVSSAFASRLRTNQALVNQWGAGMGFDFAVEPAAPLAALGDCVSGANIELDLETPAVPVDLGAYRGIVFWGRASSIGGTREIRVMLQDQNTDPRGGVCDPSPDTENACYNGFGVTLELDDGFERQEIAFDDLRQNPLWGHRPLSGRIDLERVYQLNVEVRTPGGECAPPAVCAGGSPTLEFDVWIDDLYFVSDAPR